MACKECTDRSNDSLEGKWSLLAGLALAGHFRITPHLLFTPVLKEKDFYAPIFR